MDYTEVLLKKLLEKINLQLKNTKKNYKNKEAAVYMRVRNGRYYFYELADGKTKGITSDKNRIIYLARNIKNEKEIKALENNRKTIIEALEKLQKPKSERLNKILNIFNDYESLYTAEDWNWMTEDYERNTFRSEELKYKTKRGVQVRSKSELLIGSRLEQHNLPFRTEEKMVIDGKILFPDFIIRCPDGRIVIWEHFGLMDDEDYYYRAQQKIELYRKAGFVQHKNLICTWEEDITSADDIDAIIKRFILM
ncbi:MAG: hypothetical protein IJP00_04570 [Firmicutes bacterium]|nr:hypothetical protein [Bacillota bacterium]